MRNRTLQKLAGVLTAGAMAASVMAVLPVGSSAAASEATKYGFEDAKFNGVDVYADNDGWTDVNEAGETFDLTGPSGNGFVFLGQKGTDITTTVTVPATGLYEMKICYAEPYDTNKKVQYLNVNGINQGEVSFPYQLTWKEISGGIVKLYEGENTIQLGSYCGYTFFDYITIAPADESVTNLSPVAAA